MSGVTLNVTLEDSAALAALGRLAKAGTELEPLMDEIGAGLVTSTQLRFERGEAPDGSAWTHSIRAREQGGQTLIDSGHLRDSITHAAGPSQVEVGTNVLYAALHQLGGAIKAKAKPRLTFKIGDRFISKAQVTIPARPFIGLSAGDADMVEERAAAFVEEALR